MTCKCNNASKIVLSSVLAFSLLTPTSLFLDSKMAYAEPDAETGIETDDINPPIGFDKDGNPIYGEGSENNNIEEQPDLTPKPVLPDSPPPESPNANDSNSDEEDKENNNQQLTPKTPNNDQAPLTQNDSTPSYQVVGGTPPVEDAIVQQYNSWQADVEEAERNYQEKLKLYNNAKAKMEEGQNHLAEITTQFDQDKDFLVKHLKNEYLSNKDGLSPLLRVVDAILNSTSLNDFLTLMDYYERIGETIEEKVESVRQLKEEQENLVRELEEQNKLAEESFEQATEYKAQVDAINQELTDLIENRIATYSTPEIPKEGYSDVIQAAYSRIGLPYVWGGKGEDNRSFDCSGLTMWCYKQVYGIDIGICTSDQYAKGKKIPLSELKPGDVLFRDNSSSAYQHVAIYVGGDKYIHAPSTGRLISIGTGLGSWTCGLRFVDDMEISGINEELQEDMEKLRAEKEKL